jgi:hypothetical protein
VIIMIAFVVYPYLVSDPLLKVGRGAIAHGWPIVGAGRGQTRDRVDLKIDK